MPKVKPDELRKFCEVIFEKFGFKEEESKIIVDVLLRADLYGIESHGVQRLVRYKKAMEANTVHLNDPAEIVFETPISATIDGHSGMGQLVAHKAMSLAIQKAKEHGIGMVTVRNSNHFGIAGYYAQMAQEEGLIGISMTNSESIMVHTYSRKPVLGTNPIAIAAPADPYPFYFDAATTVVPRGKLEVYAKKGKELPDGWGIDEEGKVCHDSQRVLDAIIGKVAGGILPLGGADELHGSHKGYGYAMICEIFSAILSQGATSNHHVRKPNQGAGSCHSFIAFSPALFGDPEVIRKNLSTLLQELREAPLADGATRIYTHGEKEMCGLKDRMENGVYVNPKTLLELKDAAQTYGVDFDSYFSEIKEEE